jgi:8-oxo-dGTP pyrophosphatase MutT (NUDIX family)
VPSADPPGVGDPPTGEPEHLPRFRPTGEETVHRGWFISVVRATFVDPEGVPFERDVVRHPGAVAVVAVTDDDSVVLARQFRPAINQWILEIPAGTCDVEGEPAEVTARRELAEEVGYAAGELSLLTRCVITPGFCDEFAAIYLATGLSPAPLDRQGTEEQYMLVEEIPLSRFDDLVDTGAIIDASTILGVGLARRRLASGR